MTPEHRKGSQWERDIVKYLRSIGYRAERCYGAGRPEDVGDIRGMRDVVLQAKAHKRFTLATWVDQAKTQRLNAGAGIGAVVLKRKMRPVQDAYVILPLSEFADLHTRCLSAEAIAGYQANA